MEKYTIHDSIEVVYLSVPSFPTDVMATYEKLSDVLPENKGRKFFGISHPDHTGVIRYKAAAEILPSDQLESLGLEKFTIEKGEFVAK